MGGNKKEYDLIVSLGGNCAAAHNLRIRGLRLFSYPFDWTYFQKEAAVYKISDGFKNQFQDHLLKENLIELSPNPSHFDCIQYKDRHSEIIWANHFHDKISNEKEYNQVSEKIKKRCFRLLKHIELSHNILFVFSVPFKINLEPFKYLMMQLRDLYSDKNFEVIIFSFSCPKNTLITDKGITLYQYEREMNEYDFRKTNYEWHVLDDLELSDLLRPKIGFFKKFIIKNLPFSNIRKYLRREYHV